MEVIVLIVIISLLTIVLFFALKKLIDNITNDSKEYYFKKVQDYDQKLLDKENALKDLEPNEIKTNNNSNNENEKGNRNYEIDKGFLDVVNNTDYETANALKIANRVDEIFQIDEEKIIKDFITNCKYNKNYKIYETLQARFSPNLIYKLRMLNRDGQITAISKIISDEEYEVFNAYIKSHKFKLDKFLLDLDSVIKNNKPEIEVIVGNHSKNYDYLSPYIKTTYSEDVYKGIIIKYQDRIYDYSINERDV
jgi:hypothetical protein